MRPNLKTPSIKEQLQGIERTPQPIKTPFNGIMVKDREGSLHYLILSKITKISEGFDNCIEVYTDDGGAIYLDLDIFEFLMEVRALKKNS